MKTKPVISADDDDQALRAVSHAIFGVDIFEERWVSVSECAKLLGGTVKPKSIYRLLGSLLVFKKPLPSKIEISRQSVALLKSATKNRNFWRKRSLQKPLREYVALEMAQMDAEADRVTERIIKPRLTARKRTTKEEKKNGNH